MDTDGNLMTAGEIRKIAEKLPKIELHLHLDGSLSPEFIEKQAKILDIQLPVENSATELRKWLLSQKSTNLKQTQSNDVKSGQNWSTFDFCNQFLQTADQLTEAVEDVLSRLASNQVVYAEIRFCPALHTLKSLTSEEAVRVAIKGFRNQSKVQGGIIICALRSYSREHAEEMADLAGKYLQKEASDLPGVVGYDVAGYEGGFPLASTKDTMASGVLKARSLGVPLTIHAGEWPEKFDTIKNVDFAVKNLKASRIGHGITMRSDLPLLTDLAVNTGVTVEVCLTSNIGFGYKVASYEEHPARLFYEHGLRFALSMDNWFLSGDFDHVPDPAGELCHLHSVIGSPQETWRVIRKSLLDGARAAFSPEIDDNWIRNFREKIDRILTENRCNY